MPAQRLGPRRTRTARRPPSRMPSTPRRSQLAALIARNGPAPRACRRSGGRSAEQRAAYQPDRRAGGPRDGPTPPRTGAGSLDLLEDRTGDDVRRPLDARGSSGRPRGRPAGRSRRRPDPVRRLVTAGRGLAAAARSSATRSASGSSSRRTSCSTRRARALDDRDAVTRRDGRRRADAADDDADRLRGPARLRGGVRRGRRGARGDRAPTARRRRPGRPSRTSSRRRAVERRSGRGPRPRRGGVRERATCGRRVESSARSRRAIWTIGRGRRAQPDPRGGGVARGDRSSAAGWCALDAAIAAFAAGRCCRALIADRGRLTDRGASAGRSTGRRPEPGPLRASIVFAATLILALRGASRRPPPRRPRGDATASPSRPARRTRSSRRDASSASPSTSRPEQQAERRRPAASITRYFYDGVRLGDPDARRRTIRATSGGAPLTATRRRPTAISHLEVRFRASLFFHQTAEGPRDVRPAGRRAALRRATSGSGRRSPRSSPGRSATAARVRIVIPAGLRGRDERLRPSTAVERRRRRRLPARPAITDIPASWYAVVNADRQTR